MKKKQQDVPAALDKITDVVLNYHPKPKRKAKKRKARKHGKRNQTSST